jgi:hypothetical protein
MAGLCPVDGELARGDRTAWRPAQMHAAVRSASTVSGVSMIFMWVRLPRHVNDVQNWITVSAQNTQLSIAIVTASCEA